MPILYAEIPEINEHIADPVLRQVVHGLIRKLNLQDVFQQFVYIRTKYSSNSNTSDDEFNAKLQGSKFVADVTIQQHPANVKWDVGTFSHNPAYGVGRGIGRTRPLFHDREFGITIFEQSAPCSMLLQCTMHFKSKEEAYRAPLRLFNQFREGSVFMVSDLIFDYPLPETAQYILGEIYQRKRYSTKFNRFYDYLQYWSEQKISMNQNRDGTRNELVVKKHLTEILTAVDYSDDEPGTETIGSDAPVMFTVPFQCTVQFNMPNTLYLHYPIMIENSMLPLKAIALPEAVRHKIIKSSMTDMGMDGLFQVYKLMNKEHVQTPFYDDWQVPFEAAATVASYRAFLISAQCIDEKDPVNTLDLKKSVGDDFILPSLVLDTIREQEAIKKGSTFDKDSIFNVTVYYGDEEVDKSKYTLSDDLVMTFKGRGLNQVYRVVMSELTVFEKLHPRYWPLIVKNLWNFDIYIIQQLYYYMQKSAGGWVLKIPPFWEANGWWRDPITNCFFDQKTGKKLFCLGSDGTWTDENGVKHYPELDQEGGYGSYNSSRIWRVDLRTYRDGN